MTDWDIAITIDSGFEFVHITSVCVCVGGICLWGVSLQLNVPGVASVEVKQTTRSLTHSLTHSELWLLIMLFHLDHPSY